MEWYKMDYFDIFSNAHAILYQWSPQRTLWKTRRAQQGVWALKWVSLLERVRNC